MSLQILNAHTGERAVADPVSLNSLDAFKTWLSEATSIPPSNQILLTPAGKQAKFQALLVEPEVFLYNRQVISGGSGSKGVPVPSFKATSVSSPPPPPDALSDQNSIHAWQKLFESRRNWARDLVGKSQSLAKVADGHFDAVRVIERGLGVAVDNLQNHVRGLEGKCREASDWVKQATEEQEEVLSSLADSTAQLSSLPAKKEFFRFLAKLGPPDDGATPKRRSSVNGVTLDSFARPDMVKESVDTVQRARTLITDRLGKVQGSVNKVSVEGGDLIKTVEEMQAQSVVDSSKAASQLMEEIEVVAKKIASDLEHVLTLPSTSKSLSQVSKMALLHTRNYLPTLREYFTEMTELVEHATEQRNTAIPRSMGHMRSIARVESSLAQVNSELMDLDMSTDADNAYDYISALSQLPFVYGALLIEAVRRKEWSDRLKEESATLAEDIAGYREEEERRRKKWLKNLGHFISEDVSAAGALNFELNLQAGGEEWPEASRDDISDFLQALRGLQNMEKTVEELSEAAKDLDRPTKRQIKRAKGFKVGSFHEASNTKGSFLLRESDEFRILKETNARLDDELKSQKSRVRKLEDLLHKQGQTRTNSGGDIFQIPDPQRGEFDQNSGRPDANLSRKSSATSRPSSGVKGLEEKNLSRRIVNLEAELNEERQRRQSLESEAQTRTDDHARIKSEIEESRSTKKDLMENMDAQQREFADELRLLQEQVKEGKLKVEELEDEIDRVLGSRDNEKTATEEKLRSLEAALAKANAEVTQRDDAQTDQRNSLCEIRERFSPENSAPQSMQELLEELDELAERSERQAKELTSALSAARTDKEGLQSALDRQETELTVVKDDIAALEDEATTLRDESAAAKAKATSLAAELEDGRSQLRSLRAKFAEGETGSEALRLRVEEEASRASRLATELAEAKSHVNSLDVELSSLQRRHQKLQAEAALTSRRLENRSTLDRELTNRLVSSNDELARLLESLGLSIVFRDGAIEIQRTSKLMNQSTSGNLSVPTDPAASQLSNTYDVSPDPNLLQWMQASTVEEETEIFNELLSKVSTFNLRTFSDAIIKLRRDVEWTGKKWKQEARNYREKYHRAQSEGHEKIAFRSFKEGDLALFLPTRNQATRPWAAFNVGAPHYFLRETDAHKLQNREWLVARISKVEERVVDLSRTISAGANSAKAKGRPASITEVSDGGMSLDDDNPFELSDGLRWYLLDAAEDKGGAPATPGLGKSTVASANVDAKGSIRMKKSEKGNDASGKLNKSLESRRSSSNSKRNSITGVPEDTSALAGGSIVRNSSATQLRPASTGVSAARASQEALMTGSPSNQTLGGLGIDVAPQDWATHPRPINEPHRSRNNQRNLRPSSSSAAGSYSPAKPSLLGLFGSASPPKPSWLSSDQPKEGEANPTSSLSTPVKSQIRKLPPSSLAASGTASTQSPSKLDPNAAGSGGRSASASPTKGRQQPQQQRTAWESLWSLDITSSLDGGAPSGSKPGK